MTHSVAVTRDSIRRYYDENTRLFMRFGRENETYAIHRAVWFQGVRDTSNALDASNELLHDAVRSWRDAHPQTCNPRILDLGCGVGGTLFYLLARDRELRGVGITLSAVQTELAQARAQTLRLLPRAAIIQGDFHAIPTTRTFAVAYSIEAFAHATSAETYLHQVARVLEPGGRLILCDDFLAEYDNNNANANAWLEAYQSGWHVPRLLSVAQVNEIAARAGLELLTNRDLTFYLKLRALPDFIARVVRRAGNHLPFQHPLVPSMLGSMALQQCLKLGLIKYHWLVFEKT